MRLSPARLPSLLSLRTSILAALGLAACSGDVSSGPPEPPGPEPECQGAADVLAGDNKPSGFRSCPDATVHRAEVVTCDPNVGITACGGTESMLACMSDADCTAKPHGRCATGGYTDFNGMLTTTCSCVYPCVDDAECGVGMACICGGVSQNNPTASCVRARCSTGVDCPSGECGLSIYPDGCGFEVQLACREDTDACRTDASCKAAMTGDVCAVTGDADWACLGPNCAIGRPLLVEGEARTAQPVERDGWTSAELSPSLEGLARETRERLVDHWLEIAALEHASIASFARFTLELLSLGAPADLVADAQRGALDEVEHARFAYSTASAYAGRTFGPGALNLTSVAPRSDVRAVLQSLIAEGCVGETLGVAEVIEIAGRASDPALQRLHARVAADEQRHAELSWRALAWLLKGADAEMVRFAARCFEEVIAAASRDPVVRAVELPEHGVLSAGDIRAIRRRAIADIIRPCAAALLEERGLAPSAEAISMA